MQQRRLHCNAFIHLDGRKQGVCLVTEISATVYLPDGSQVQATPYESSGTSYSQYSIIQQGPKNFTVTRVVSLADDLGVIDQPEPTENQK